MRPPGHFMPVLLPAFSFDLSDSEEESPQYELNLVDPAPQPDEVLQRKQEITRVHEFVRTLTPKNRDIVHRHYWDDQSQAEIARDLRVSEAAISKRMHKVVTAGKANLADLEIN